MLTPSSLSVLFIIIILFIYLVRVSALRKRGSRQGSGTAQRTPLFTTEEMMRSTLPSLSALGSLPPPTLFFSPSLNWPWLRRRIVLAKM